ncbi:MAG: NAD(P)H-dependent oxidoreductase subunit E [Firmicutes bacterium]|nr:NAD(P)H-dependent oxidoreductase subunit E [Bacillota bacterium]
MNAAFEVRRLDKLNQIIAAHGRDLSSLIPILQDVQAEYRYLPEEVLAYVATALDIPVSVVYGVATFYAQFSTEPKGRYVIKVCNGTACHVRGSDLVHSAIRRALGLEAGRKTTPDLAFTVERVNCVGACSMAPVVTVNDQEVFGEMTQAEAVRLVERLRREAEEGGAEEAGRAAHEAVGEGRTSA